MYNFCHRVILSFVNELFNSLEQGVKVISVVVWIVVCRYLLPGSKFDKV